MGVTGMYCLKCGCEISEPEVFCKKCLSSMRNFPVRPDAVIHIPERPAPPVEKPQKKKKSYADYVRTLRRTIKTLCIILVVLTLLVCGLCALVYHQYQGIPDLPAIGRNYTTTDQNNP